MMTSNLRTQTITPNLIPLALSLLFATSAAAEIRTPYEDAIVAERAELIVIGTIRPDSIRHVPHVRKKGDGASWEYHATLRVDSTLKGKCDEKELPIIIHYGLSPVVRRNEAYVDFRNGASAAADERVDLLDRFQGPTDIGKTAHLWFLRKGIRRITGQKDYGRFGILDPEDVQPSELTEYFRSYLAKPPEPAVQAFIKKHPELTTRAQPYFDHCEVTRILKIRDANKRVDRLTPYFVRRVTWQLKNEAADGIVAAGDVGGLRLLKIFDDPKHHDLRQSILLLWRRMEFKPVAGRLIDLLEEHEEFWALQSLESGWWNDQKHPQADERRSRYGEVYYAVCALRKIKERNARDAIEMTLRRWKSIGFDNPQIVEACEAALRELPLR